MRQNRSRPETLPVAVFSPVCATPPRGPKNRARPGAPLALRRVPRSGRARLRLMGDVSKGIGPARQLEDKETEIMAQALGYVTQRDTGDFEGVISMGLNAKIRIVPNDAKETEKQPDYRVFIANGGEIGGGWNRVGKASGKPYLSLTLAHPMIGPRRVYANLGRAAGRESGEFAILWNPA